MRFRRRLSINARVDLVPMIDVVFQLVVFFMVSSTFIVTPGINLALPQSSSAEPVAVTKMVITVKSQQEVYLNDKQYTIKGLDDALSQLKKQEREAVQTILVEGDKNVSYNIMIELLDVLRKNGFKGVNLKTREE